MTDYYKVLGVHSDAEDFVIRAAFKALAQKYHPDKYQGSKDDALQKMHLINEAYEVLSDPVKRQNYDASFQQQNQTQNNQSSTQADSEEERAWKIALEYHPELQRLISRLTLFSDELAQEFKSALISSKQFDKAQALAKQAEQEFLEDYFGHDNRVVEFARELLLAGHKQAAKEFNETLIAMGSSVDIQAVIERVEQKYSFRKPHKPKEGMNSAPFKNKSERNQVFDEQIIESARKIEDDINKRMLITILIVPVITFVLFLASLF